MGNEFKPFALRNVFYHRLVELDGWQVKTYKISPKEAFGSQEILENALAALPTWMEKAGELQLPTHRSAFLIVHEGGDGVWSILSWWIGGDMLQTTTYFTPYEQPGLFRHYPNNSSMACVWELAVVCHERKAWIEHVLKKADAPDFSGYLNDILEGSV